jgi:hypothetical protein
MNVNSYKTLHLNPKTKITGFGCTYLYAPMHRKIFASYPYPN